MINAFGYLLAFLGVQSQVPQRGYASLCTPYDFVIPVRHAAPNPESIMLNLQTRPGFRVPASPAPE